MGGRGVVDEGRNANVNDRFFSLSIMIFFTYIFMIVIIYVHNFVRFKLKYYFYEIIKIIIINIQYRE